MAINSKLRLLAVTAPHGNRVFVWNLDTAELRLDAPLADCAGIAAVAEGFVVSSGQSGCRLYAVRLSSGMDRNPPPEAAGGALG